MDGLFTLHENGMFLRRDAIELGYDDRDLARARRSGTIERIRQGTYLPSHAWRTADAEARHLLTAQGVMLRHENRVALSHVSGALAYGMSLWEPDLTSVHVTRLAGSSGRQEAGVIYHRDQYDLDTIHQRDELLMVGPARCALGAAGAMSVEAGMVCLDSFLHHELGDTDDLWHEFEAMRHTPFTRPLQIALRLARAGAESVGESRSRILFYAHHLPEPVLQYKVYDGNRLIGICDFAWPEYRLLGEFDGKVKYGRLLRPGQDPGDVVFEEKKREDALREATGWGMIRYTYGDLYVPQRTAGRTARMLFDRRTA